MVWDILLQAAASFVIGAAIGYGFAAIVEALSRRFAQLWENFVAIAQSIFSYVSDATKYFLATLMQSLENNWAEIESYLRQEFGYRRNWLVGIFRDGQEAFLAMGQQEKEPIIFSIGEIKSDVQLPTMQNPMVTELVVA